MAVLFCAATVGILGRIAPGRDSLPPRMLIVSMFLMAHALWEFTPGRIDHHNVQMLLLLALVYGVARFNKVGGIIVGISATISVLVGLETLPIIALALASLTIVWTTGNRGARAVLASASATCLIAAPLLALLFLGPSGLWVASNDEFSAPYALALFGFGFTMTAILRSAPETLSGLSKFALVGFCGLALLGALLFAYPGLLAGPYAGVDNLTRTYWLDRINQEKSALQFYRIGDFGSLGLLVIFGCVLIISFRRAIDALRRGQPAVTIIYAVAAGMFLMALASNRYLRFAAAVVPLLLPAAIVTMRELLDLAKKRLIVAYAAVVGAIVAMAISLHFIIPVELARTDAFDYLFMNDCASADFSVLSTLSPGHIMTPPGVGLQIARRLPPGLTVSGIPFHRAAPAMRRVLQTFMSENERERAPLLAGFDYVAICRAPSGLPGSENMPLFKAIMTDKLEPDLSAVSNLDSDLVILRVNR